MEKDLAKQKSKRLAIRIIRMYKYLCEEKKEYILSKQVLRSGTSIGANIAESEFAISKKDFLSKIYIALKETAETIYWLDLLHQTDYINDAEYDSIYNDCVELLKILQATTKTVSLSLKEEDNQANDDT